MISRGQGGEVGEGGERRCIEGKGFSGSYFPDASGFPDAKKTEAINLVSCVSRAERKTAVIER